MPATVRTLDEIRADYLRDILNQRADADVGSDSDYYVRGSAIGSVVEGLYQYQDYISKQFFPDTADEPNLIKHARLYNIERKSAVAASGTVTVTGAPGADVPSGLNAKYKDGTAYTTTSSGKLDESGALTVDVTANVAGVGGNRNDGDVLTLTVPPANVNATVTIVNVRGGTNVESLDALLARLLLRLRRPPAGGNRYDYWQWAMEVPGVTAAFVYPLRRGLGTVDVVIASNGGLPSDEVVKAAQAHIDDQRPVRAKDTLVIVPTLKTYDVAAQVRVKDETMDNVRTSIRGGLSAYDAVISPADTVIRNRIGGIINDARGVVDYVLATPAENVVPTVSATVIEWCRLGNVTIEPIA